MKKKQIVIIVAIALVIVGVLLYRKFTQDKLVYEEEEEGLICPDFSPEWGETSEDLMAVFGSTGPEDNNWSTTTISLGDYNHQVLYAQFRLNSQYSAGIKEDGKFGCETFYAVVELTGYDAINGFDINDLK